MSFGFGSNNNNNSNTFGGFGSSNTGGFGSNNNASTGGSLFGGSTATSGGFGGFGSNNTSTPFGGANKPAFGAPAPSSSGGGLFGNNANTSTSGGFGSGGGFGATANTGGFGSNTGGGLFGQNKPATTGFGASNTGGSLFGGGNTGGGFGASNSNNNNPFSTSTNTNTNTGFGASNTGGGFTFGGASNTANNNGTASTPFQAFTEKDQGTTGSSAYQSITFQPPYQNKSFEELRVEDYAQGRRFGNSNGQAGSFGQSTGFGGFGSNASTGGGMFGGNTATSGTGGFGQNTGGFGNSNTGGFGSNTNTSGSLFAQSKPTTGGLFGSNTSGTATGGFGSTSNNAGGGLFGSGGGGFGSNTTQTNTGGGLFGNNNQQQQNKPAFGGFGATTNTTSGFGNTNTGGGLFGASNNNNSQNTGGGLFGQNNQQQQTQQNSNPFGSTNTGGGLFGNNQNKPATGGLFGNTTNTNTGGGLFGAQNNNQQNNAFGSSTNTGGGLFGNQNQNKPATGGGLFGSSTNNNTGGGLFGNQNNSQQSGGGLFGGGNANAGGSLFGQNKPTGGLFGSTNTNTNNNNAGGVSLFGGNNQNQQGNTGSLFGASLNSNQNQNNANSNALFGSVNQGNQQSTPQNQLHASLTGAPYGNEQLFSSLGAASPPVGPLATPLAGAKPSLRKTPSLLASARFNTPAYSPRGSTTGRNGYGFSYSTYGTPGSAYTSGSLTPGASSLLRPTGSLGSALAGRLSKSLSTSNLRGDGTPGEGRSLLRPSAFSPDGTPGRFQSGGLRKLKIDRSLRNDLFGAVEQPKAVEAAKETERHGLRKQVSFENASSGEMTATPSSSNALVRTEEDENEAPPLQRPSEPRKPQQPEMEQVNGSNGSLTTVPEDREAPRPSSAPGTNVPAEKNQRDPEPGEYWTKPSLKDLKNMSRQQLRNVGNFIVGREGVGRVEFGSVDLTNTTLDDICGGIVQLVPRIATVYQDDHTKPAVGQALNVPSTIHLLGSWPRSHGGKNPVHAKSGKAYDKHIARLKRVTGTHFISYNADTGMWTFKVDHFTTYGLDDDDESEFPDDTSALSDPPATPSGQQDLTMQSVETANGEMDDTFQFKIDKRSQLSVPGGFDEDGIDYDYDYADHEEDMQEDDHVMSGGLRDTADPFTSGAPVQLPSSPGPVDRYHSSMMDEDELETAEEIEQDLPGSFVPEPKAPKSILKPGPRYDAFMSPEKLALDTWEDQLQRTISPKKRDRQALKELQQGLLQAPGDDVEQSPFKKSMLGQSALDQSYLAQRSAKRANNPSKLPGKGVLGESQAFRNSMDVMKSLFQDDHKAGRKVAAGARGFEIPYPKRRRLSLQPADEQWLHCLRPSLANNNLIMFAVPPATAPVTGELAPSRIPALMDSHKQIRFARTVTPSDLETQTLAMQQQQTNIDASQGFPLATPSPDILFAWLADDVQQALPISARETSIWRLSSILFDPLDVVCADYATIPEGRVEELELRMRMDALAAFWVDVVETQVFNALKRAATAEEKALVYLTRNDIVGACEVLMSARNFKLATLVSQSPGSDTSRAMMKGQITVWRERNDWSEMSEAVRALYSILAGDVCIVEGITGAAENRVSEFNIRARFELSWQQSFALRLFFGGHRNVAEVVQAYVADLESTREPLLPTRDWADLEETRDTLMEILHLAAQDHGYDGLGMLNAKAVSGTYFDSRLAWQMGCLMDARGVCEIPGEKLDALTLDFATELETAGRVVMSVWVLLHIRDNRSRQTAISALLDRNGGLISTPSQDGQPGTFEELREVCQIPVALLWKSKALFAQSQLHDPALQTHWLVRAGLIDKAHEVLCSILGPKAVIEQDFDAVEELLSNFPAREAEGWAEGGQVYADFVALVRARRAQKGIQVVDMRRLRTGLAALEERAEGGKGELESRAAVVEMKRVLEDVLREEGEVQREGRRSTLGAVVGGGAEGVAMLERYRRAMGMVA